MKKSEMQQLTNESKKTQKINQWETRIVVKWFPQMSHSKAVKKSEMQQLTNESTKAQKINQQETRNCGKVVVSLDVPPQGCEED